MNTRSIALEIINDVLNNGAYSNLSLNQKIKENNLNEKDIALLTEIVYGTIKNIMLLDYYLEPYLKIKKPEPWFQNLLRMSVYQLKFLDKVPNYAIVNEAVNIAKKKSKAKLDKMVNAILRNIIRNGFRSLDEIKDEKMRLSIETSYPMWIIDLWERQFGFDITKKICFANMETPLNTARVNINDEGATELFQKYEKGLLSKNAIIVSSSIVKLKEYKEGLISPQDEASMYAVEVLNPKSGDIILDMCAAPGGKSLYMASLMENIGEIHAVDLYEHKIKLIKENIMREKATIIKPKVYDATKLTEVYKEETFDKILLDAPCSGLGVIKRKPEIKYNRTLNDIYKLVSLQKELINVAGILLKKGGYLLYSTCTLNKLENEEIINEFLNQNKNFELINSKIIYPYQYNSDGFSIFLLQKIKDKK